MTDTIGCRYLKTHITGEILPLQHGSKSFTVTREQYFIHVKHVFGNRHVAIDPLIEEHYDLETVAFLKLAFPLVFKDRNKLKTIRFYVPTVSETTSSTVEDYQDTRIFHPY